MGRLPPAALFGVQKALGSLERDALVAEPDDGTNSCVSLEPEVFRAG
jgi:hypothetical protein